VFVLTPQRQIICHLHPTQAILTPPGQNFTTHRLEHMPHGQSLLPHRQDFTPHGQTLLLHWQKCCQAGNTTHSSTTTKYSYPGGKDCITIWWYHRPDQSTVLVSDQTVL